jgi:hypothetical protein
MLCVARQKITFLSTSPITALLDSLPSHQTRYVSYITKCAHSNNLCSLSVLFVPLSISKFVLQLSAVSMMKAIKSMAEKKQYQQVGA